MKTITKATLSIGMVVSLAAAANGQISNNRNGNGNLIRHPGATNNATPMINSTSSNPKRPAPNLAPTADQNIAPWQRK
jgi:hypothetical protein